MIVYDAGYGRTNKAITLLARCEELNALVIDTRIKPTSWRSEWRRPALQSLFAERYQWWGNVWGNRHYNPNVLSPPSVIVLVNFAVGLARLEQLTGFDAVVLLCGCRSAIGCHRGRIVSRLQQRGWTCRALDWRPAHNTPVEPTLF